MGVISNGTAALHLSVFTLGIKENTKVITSPIPFAATANCVSYYIIEEKFFTDIEEKSTVLDIDRVRELRIVYLRVHLSRYYTDSLRRLFYRY